MKRKPVKDHPMEVAPAKPNSQDRVVPVEKWAESVQQLHANVKRVSAKTMKRFQMKKLSCIFLKSYEMYRVFCYICVFK